MKSDVINFSSGIRDSMSAVRNAVRLGQFHLDDDATDDFLRRAWSKANQDAGVSEFWDQLLIYSVLIDDFAWPASRRIRFEGASENTFKLVMTMRDVDPGDDRYRSAEPGALASVAEVGRQVDVRDLILDLVVRISSNFAAERRPGLCPELVNRLDAAVENVCEEPEQKAWLDARGVMDFYWRRILFTSLFNSLGDPDSTVQVRTSGSLRDGLDGIAYFVQIRHPETSKP